MPTKNSDLHGNAPDKCKIATLLIDVINDFDFHEADELLRFAVPMAHRIARLRQRAKQEGIPVIYANDNFGRWRSDFKGLIDHCLRPESKGKSIVELLRPEEDDYFVLKPKHSAFFSTTLDILLEYLGVETIVLVGVATNICVLFTANDAYLRDFNIAVPSDCVAANNLEDHRYALEQMQNILKAQIDPSTDVGFDLLLRLSANPKIGVYHGHE